MSVLNDRQDPTTDNRKPVRGKMSCCRNSRLEKCKCNMTRATMKKRANKLTEADAVADIFSCETCPSSDKSRIAKAVRVVRKANDKKPRLHSKIHDLRTMLSCHDISTALLCVQNLGESRFVTKDCVQFKKVKSNHRFLSQLERSQNHSSYEPILSLTDRKSRGYAR
jgi:hypothetical protein